MVHIGHSKKDHPKEWSFLESPEQTKAAKKIVKICVCEKFSVPLPPILKKNECYVEKYPCNHRQTGFV